jgi:hypothetical protein
VSFRFGVRGGGGRSVGGQSGPGARPPFVRLAGHGGALEGTYALLPGGVGGAHDVCGNRRKVRGNAVFGLRQAGPCTAGAAPASCELAAR